MAKKRQSTTVKSKRVYLSQADVPRHELDEALRIPTALVNEFGKKPTSPLNVAAALNLSPNSSHFRSICGAAVAYGLTDGGPFADEIKLTELGRRAVAPTAEGDDLAAKQQSLLRPRVIGDFLKRFEGSRLPRPDIAANILSEMGVPKEHRERVFGFVVDGAKSVGFLKTIKGSDYVQLEGATYCDTNELTDGNESDTSLDDIEEPDDIAVDVPPSDPIVPARKQSIAENRNVFITHGKNRAFIESLKQLLTFGNFEPVVSIENETVSMPIPEKVMSDMRKCGAAIIHVDSEMRLIDEKGEQHDVLNPNVLIEIGAAMALYQKRFIILLKQGVKLPSNLQGLSEVRYDGEKLDGDTTIRLLKAINDIKNHPVP